MIDARTARSRSRSTRARPVSRRRADRPRPGAAARFAPTVSGGLCAAPARNHGQRSRPAWQVLAGATLIARDARDAPRHVGIVPDRRCPRRARGARSRGLRNGVGCRHRIQRPAALRGDGSRAERRDRASSGARRTGTRAVVVCLRRRGAGPRLRRTEDAAQGGAPRSTRGGGFGKHLRQRCVEPGPALTAAARRDHRDAGRPAAPERASARRRDKEGAVSCDRSTGRDSDRSHPFRVYYREGQRCPNRGCAGVIRRITQAGRSTFYCSVCQRRATRL